MTAQLPYLPHNTHTHTACMQLWLCTHLPSCMWRCHPFLTLGSMTQLRPLPPVLGGISPVHAWRRHSMMVCGG